MNGNLLVTMLEANASGPGLSAILQTYWYAFAAIPAVLIFAMVTRSRKKHKVYRW